MAKIISGFSTSNHITLGKTFTIGSNRDTWEFVTKAMMTSGSTYQQLLAFYWSDTKGFLARISNSNKIQLYVGNGSSWFVNGVNGTTTLSLNTWYWLKWTFDGSYYKAFLSTDGETWNQELSVNNTTPMNCNNYQMYLGWRATHTGEYWRGKINLDETYFKLNNEYFFNGATDTNYTTGIWRSNSVGPCISKDEGWINFSTTSYLTFGSPFNFGSDPWEMIFKIQISNNFSRNQEIIGTPTHTDFKDVCLCLFTDRKLKLYLGHGGSSWDIAQQVSSTSMLADYQEYYIKLLYDTTGYYCYLSTTGEFNGEETLEIYVDDPNPIYYSGNVQSLGYHSWGTGSDDYYIFYGIINLKDCIIKQNNTIIFNGATAVEGTDYSIVGSPIYIDKPNIAYGFNRNSSLTLNPIVYNNNSKNAKGIIRAYFVLVNSLQDIITRSTGVDRCWCLQSANASNANKLDFYNGSSHMSTTTFKNNTWYWVAYEWNGSTYKFYSMLDDGTFTNFKELPSFSDSRWTLEQSYNDANNNYETGFRLGLNSVVDDSNRYWRGMIDLNNVYIGNNIINWEVGKEGYITKSGMQVISQDTTENVTLQQGVKLTISPDQVDANVIMWANGYKQTRGTNTLTAVEGTEVHYTVSKPRYKTVSGTYTLGSSDYDLYIELEELSEIEINMTYPFTDEIYSPFIEELTNNGNFIINSSLNAITNKGIGDNGQVNGYFSFTTGTENLTLSVTGYVSSEGGYDFGAVYCGTSIYNMNRSQMSSGTTDGNGQFLFRGSGGMSKQTYTIQLQPETTYYLNFGYAKDRSSSSGSDRLIVTDINFYALI